MLVALDIDTRVPLVVDLDGTLTLTDTLCESVVTLAFHRPLAAAKCLFVLGRGLAAFKRQVARHVLPDAEALPYRGELIDLIKSEKARGREVHLVTASDQAAANAVAGALGLFTSATGSDGVTNLKGEAKLAHLRARFPDGFIYAGDGAADVPIFRAARGAILCDASRATAAAVAKSGTPVLGETRRPAPGLKTWARAFRVHQWSKNLLIFVPLFVGHAYGDPDKIVATALGFVALCVLASATYVINDLADLDADRFHPVKRLRPLASCAIPIRVALIVAPVMILAALAGAYLLSPAFAAALFAYLLLTLAYSFGLKRVALLDVFAIGLLFTLRVVMGAAVAKLTHSSWLLTFALAFFLSLALAKRHGEVLRAARIDVEEIAGRGYRGDDWPITLAFGIGAGLMSVVIMLLYMTNEAAPSGFYQQQAWLYVMPAVMSLWLMRIWLLSHRLSLQDDPVVFALQDRASLALGLAAAIAFWMAH